MLKNKYILIKTVNARKCVGKKNNYLYKHFPLAYYNWVHKYIPEVRM